MNAVVVILSSHSREKVAPVPLVLVRLIASWMTGLRRLGPSVKSRIVLMLPSIGMVNVADALKEMTPRTPTYGMSEPEAALKTGPNGLPNVELTSSIAREPFGPFCGWKKVQMPLLPAGQATTSLGPIMDRLESGNGLVMTACVSLLQSEWK